MSEQENAQGRTLRYDYEPGYCGELVTETGWSICSFTDEPSKANAERLVACWNACLGIDTADLKSGSVSIINKLHDEAAKLVLAQRDELLAAMLRIASTKPQHGMNPNAKMSDPDDVKVGWNVHFIARAAIAKVEGGA